MITRIKVEVVTYKWVEIEVDHDPEDDPCDLTATDQDNALSEAEFVDADTVSIERVKVA